MATASVKFREEAYKETVTKYKIINDGITLTLSDDEAQALRALFDSIGGSPGESGRGKTDAISKAFDDAGYTNEKSKYKGKTRGNIYFSDSEPFTW